MYLTYRGFQCVNLAFQGYFLLSYCFQENIVCPGASRVSSTDYRLIKLLFQL